MGVLNLLHLTTISIFGRMKNLHQVQVLFWRFAGSCYGRNFSSEIVQKKADVMYVDPTLEIQRFLRTPLFKTNEKSFNPSLSEMKAAEQLFTDSSQLQDKIKFLTSVIEYEKCPGTELPEVTFIGQSNVGKSSLLKAILRGAKKNLVKTSSRPGHTKSLNFFQVKDKLFLVDVPGFGFKQPKHYVTSVEKYLKKRTNLKRTFLITDCQNGISEWDLVALQMLEEFQIPYALILTKIDLAPVSQRLINLVQLQNIRDQYASPYCFPQPFLISSLTYEGLAYLQCFIAYTTSNVQEKN